MFIGIIIGIALFCGLVSVFGGILKKIMEVISFIVKLGLGGMVTMLVFQWLNIEFSSPWWQLLAILVGAIIVFSLIMLLASLFRLVGFSINFFLDSFIVVIAATILKEYVEINFITYAIVLFLFPRVMWISDRYATTTEYSHSDYSFWDNVTTDFYTIKDMDWWGNASDAWGLMPLQIIISALFYGIGCITLLAVCPIQQGWLAGLYLVLATAINILFDTFVFRHIDDGIA